MPPYQCIPGPRLRRVVRLVALDEAGLLLLAAAPGTAVGTLPALWLRPGDSYAAAARHLQQRLGVHVLRPGTVSGHRWAPAGPALRVEERFHLVRVRRGSSVSPPGHHWCQPGRVPPHGPRWAEVHRLIEGYLQGWIPDGPIRLEWDERAGDGGPATPTW
ncbi:hypothetical protein [Streptomyces sp. NPDC017529]|uniref:hypothetical protein n=1 Tax=Streptomyces sp. NPDC017529 TaxID=3365000 RepID=UPI00378E31A5